MKRRTNLVEEAPAGLIRDRLSPSHRLSSFTILICLAW
jgi:hypothetical protein